jgi:DNA ligase-associated metallophosphoesterase
MPDACEIEFGGATLTLTGERAVWWARERTLLLADLHLGKPASFRERGAPVPEEVTASDLARVSSLVERCGAETLLILGDLAHDRAAWREVTLDAVAAWRRSHASLGITLVRGNHDRWADDPPPGLGIEVVEPGWSLGGLAMHHEPPERAALPALCGHLHPGVRLHPAGRPKRAGMRTPCYWFSPTLGVFPAFGRFTGCAMIRPRERDRVFAVGDGKVMEINGTRAA